MGYKNEKASNINHQYIIENKKVQDFLLQCEKTDDNNPLEEQKMLKNCFFNIKDVKNKFDCKIEYIVAIDGGYQEININDNYPSQILCFYNIGILAFRIDNLIALEEKMIINPKDLERLKDLERFNFVMPIQNIRIIDKDFKTTIRQRIFDIFVDNVLKECEKETYRIIDTIKWLVFNEYKDSHGSIEFACPTCNYMNIFIKQNQDYINNINNSIYCKKCGNIIYITDCFELHTLVDEINGATSIESYILSIFEVMLMLSIFRFCFEKNIQLLSKILFIKDGSLALFNRLDNFSFKIVRPFLQFIYDMSIKNKMCYANIIGLDKSGIFVDHFSNIESKINPQSIVIPNLDYMKKYITGNNKFVFGANTYFGIKIFVKIDKHNSFLLDIAIPFGEKMKYEEYIKQPDINDFLNLNNILEILIKLKCDMYDKAFVPIAMINKLISLSQITSNKILKVFSQNLIDK